MLGRWLSGVGVLVVCALAPVSASVAEKPTTLLPFQLEADNGWKFFGLVASPGGTEGEVALFGRRGLQAVAYGAPATVTETTIDADLGDLGKISLALVPTGRTRLVRMGCEGDKRQRIETARYEGTIDFHGEEGYTEFSATRVPAYYGFYSRILCADGEEYSGGFPGRRLPGARLDVESRVGDQTVLEFGASKDRPGSRTTLSVEAREQRGEIAISRATFARAGADAFRFDPALRRATLAPPAPFAGHATFRRGAEPANRWTGNLTVDLPGRSDMPLTGPGLEVTLSHPRS